ncbi:MAG: hypothetical protein RJB19_516 [Pseudomonadota bacterium]
MDSAVHQIAQGIIHKAVTRDGPQAREAIRGDQHLEMATPFGRPCMSLVGVRIIPDLKLRWTERLTKARLDDFGESVLRHCWVSLTWRLM